MAATAGAWQWLADHLRGPSSALASLAVSSSGSGGGSPMCSCGRRVCRRKGQGRESGRLGGRCLQAASEAAATARPARHRAALRASLRRGCMARPWAGVGCKGAPQAAVACRNAPHGGRRRRAASTAVAGAPPMHAVRAEAARPHQPSIRGAAAGKPNPLPKHKRDLQAVQFRLT